MIQFMKYEYKTQGVCSKQINLEMENGVIKEVSFVGGCQGNLSGIARLVAGVDAGKVISLLQDIKCPSCKASSCPDQLAKALTQIISV